MILLPFVFKYKKKLFVYLFLTTLLGYSHFLGNVQPTRNADKRLTDKSFTLMTYNIGGNPPGNAKGKKVNQALLTEDKMAIVRDARPNLLCLQENRSTFAYSDEGNTAKTLPYYAHSVTDKQYATAIYSDFPIRKYAFFAITTPPSNVAMYADIALGDRTVRVFNIHLKSNQLGTDADNFVKRLDNIDEEEGKETYVRTYKKLRNAWQKRAIQADIIADSIAASPYPTIVCGDFNDTPSSYAYRILSSGLRDAFRHGGRGVSFSYNGNLPAVSIDHILVAKNYPVYGFRVVRKLAGDHYPVRAEIGY